MATQRKVFQIIVDETAFTTNISEIKKWLAHGAITILVPLYTLECLRYLKKDSGQVGINAREAVRFLDRVTSGKDSIPVDRVVVEGPQEQYQSWAEVMEHLLPEYQQEIEKDSQEVEHIERQEEANDGPLALSQELLAKLNFRDAEAASNQSAESVRSAAASPPSSQCSGVDKTEPILPKESQSNSKTAGLTKTTTSGPVPENFRPLLNSALWRVAHHAALNSSCVLITNNPECRDWAQMFGIPVKNIHQLRTAITYEDKETKNRNKYMEKSMHTTTTTTTPEPKTMLSFETAGASDEDEEVIFVPRGRGKSMKGTPGVIGSPAQGATGNRHKTRKSASSTTPTRAEGLPNVEVPSEPIDPNSFRRTLGPAKPAQVSQLDSAPLASAPRSPAKHGNQPRYARANGRTGGGRGGHHPNAKVDRDVNGNGTSSPKGIVGNNSNGRGNGLRGGRGRGTLFVP